MFGKLSSFFSSANGLKSPSIASPPDFSSKDVKTNPSSLFDSFSVSLKSNSEKRFPSANGFSSYFDAPGSSNDKRLSSPRGNSEAPETFPPAANAAKAAGARGLSFSGSMFSIEFFAFGFGCGLSNEIISPKLPSSSLSAFPSSSQSMSDFSFCLPSCGGWCAGIPPCWCCCLICCCFDAMPLFCGGC